MVSNNNKLIKCHNTYNPLRTSLYKNSFKKNIKDNIQVVWINISKTSFSENSSNQG